MRPVTVPAVGKGLPERAVALPRIVISNGTLEALKWLALVLMTLDHANKYVFAHMLPGAFELGRLAMPIFGFVLAYNLARPGALASGVHVRTMKRLTLYGVAATPFFIGLGGLLSGWWPLNIMFTLLVAAGVLYLMEKGGFARLVGAAALFLFGGAMVEFWWFALAFVVAAWWYFKTANKLAVVICILALAALFVVNKNLWALAAVPLMLAAPLLDLNTPRLRRVFYAFYPAHLAFILMLSKVFDIH